MDITQGNIFWEKGMNIKYNYPYLTCDKSCDILVIGGGISGALSAYFQAKQGYNVILVEKNLIGFNATLENIGTVIAKAETKLMKKTPKEVKRIEELVSKALQDLVEIIKDINKDEEKVKYALCNLINFSERASGRFALSKLYDEELAKKQDVTLVEENSVLDIYSALEYKNKALIFNPYIFNQELVYMLNSMKNVEVYENTCVESINSKEHEVEIQTTNRFKIHAKKVIMATGIALAKYLREDELEVYKTYNIVATLPQDIKRETFVATDNFGSDKIIRVTGEHIILSGENIKKTVKSSDITYEEKFANGKYRRLYNHLLKLLDRDDVKIKNCFYGVYLSTKDSLPIVDELDQMPNVYCNLGIGRNGILYNVLGAEMLKSIYNDCYTKDMYLFRENR